jgi:ketosteroid isomerase-like protein
VDEEREVVRRWLAAINGHDVSALAALMAEGHVFVDSLGNRVDGATSMERGWRGYLAMCPDYWVRPEHLMREGETVLVAGEAGGTIDGEAWRTPFAAQAAIRGGKVAEWRVFADNKPVYAILARRRPG